MRRRGRRLLLRAGLLVWAGLAGWPACAAGPAETAVFVGNIAPYAYPPEHGARGVMFELMHEMALRTGHSGTVQVVPLAREVESLRLNSDALGVLTRLPEREAHYRWIAPLLRERMLLVTRAGSAADISTVDAARPLRVGVLLGGPAEASARRLGFQHIETTTSVASNIRKLAAGRLDALVVLGGIAAAEEAQPAGQALAWREGALLETVDIYLAGNPGFPAASAQAWQAALKAMRQDGSYQRILARYHYAPIK